MSTIRSLVRISICSVLLATALVAGAHAQSEWAGPDVPGKAAKQWDEFGRLNGEDKSARFDSFFHQISQNPGSMGYVVLYCGKKCRYGEIDAHLRGIELKVATRKFDRSRLVTVNAGFRENFAIELWLVPKDGCAPKVTPTVNIRYVVFSAPGKHLMEAYDCCDDLSDVWKNYKP